MKRTSESDIARVLTIAGSDSGGGAGIQADLKTFAAFSTYGMSVITAVTAQNTLGVQGVEACSPEFVVKQLESVLSDIGADAIKIGMLANSETVAAVAETLRSSFQGPVVLDPVMVAKGGASLLQSDAVKALKEHLIPNVTVLTPNIPEAEVLCGYRITSVADMHKAAADLAVRKGQVIVLKGGHAQFSTDDETTSMVLDLVYVDGTYTTLLSPRVDTVKTHGTGCTFSAAIASGLARGLTMLDAIATAKAFVYHAIRGADNWSVGAGHGPIDHRVAPRFANGIVADGTYKLMEEAYVSVSKGGIQHARS